MSEELNRKLSEWANVAYEILFTSSLDACFKWLVPEAHKRELEIRLWSFYDLSNDKFFYFSHLQNPKGEVQCASMVGEEEAAMSVCRTFEMLIDEEAKDVEIR